MGEREQKREMQSPTGADSLPGHSWTYYLLNGTREQLSVWSGASATSAGTCSWLSGPVAYLYPSEYLVYAVEYPGIREDIPRLKLTPDGVPEYRITDHLASVRQTLDENGQTVNQLDYEPYGAVLSSQGVERQSFNSREHDGEDGRSNNGVRKLDEGLGRFVAVDPLWESSIGASPYVYCLNAPLTTVDPTGLQGVPTVEGLMDQYVSETVVTPIIGITENPGSAVSTDPNVQGMVNGGLGMIGGASMAFAGAVYSIETSGVGAALGGGAMMTLGAIDFTVSAALFLDSYNSYTTEEAPRENLPANAGALFANAGGRVVTGSAEGGNRIAGFAGGAYSVVSGFFGMGTALYTANAATNYPLATGLFLNDMYSAGSGFVTMSSESQELSSSATTQGASTSRATQSSRRSQSTGDGAVGSGSGGNWQTATVVPPLD